MPPPETNPAKAALRSQVRAALRAIEPAQHKAWSAAIVNAIAALPQFQASRAMLFYRPLPQEVDILPLAAQALAAGKVIAFPSVDWSNPAANMTCRAVTNLDRDFEPRAGPAPNPLASRPEVPLAQIDLIITPGLGFDAQCRRLGRGGGHYDRLLAHPDRRAFAVAPCFAVQVVQTVPSEAHDRPVDLVVTERGPIRLPQAQP